VKDEKRCKHELEAREKQREMIDDSIHEILTFGAVYAVSCELRVPLFRHSLP